MTNKPYKGQHAIYRAIGGANPSEYAAIITDVRPEGVCLTTFPPGGGSVYLSGVRYVPYAIDVDRAVCFPALVDDTLRK